MCPSVMAWLISHQPQHKCDVPHLTQTQSLLITATHRTGWPNLGRSLQLLLGQLCHVTPCLPQLAPARHEMEVVLLSCLLWRPPVFPGNTESHGNWVSLPETWMVIGMGHSQMPLDLQGCSSCLVE